MYDISNFLISEIKKAGGIDAFANKYDLDKKAVEGYYNGTRQIQLTTLIALAVALEFQQEKFSDKKWLLELCKKLVDESQHHRLEETWGSQL